MAPERYRHSHTLSLMTAGHVYVAGQLQKHFPNKADVSMSGTIIIQMDVIGVAVKSNIG